MLTGAALIGSIVTPAAAEFTVDPYVSGGVRYDTNPRYLDNSRFDPDSAWGTIVDARLPMEWRSPRVQVSFDPRIVYSFYPDSEDDDLEDRDHYLIGDASWMGRRSGIGADYGYTDLALRTSEFQNAGGTPGGSGDSPIFARGTQQRWYFQPYWQYQFSPANSLLLNGGYEEVRYDEDIFSNRFDYDYAYASATFSHAFSYRHTLGLRAQFTKFDSENLDATVQNDSETNSLSLIYQYQWSETTELAADVGWARTKSEVKRPNAVDPVLGPFCNPALIPFFPCEIDFDSSNFVGNLTATKTAETVKYQLIVGQSITPNSNGAEVLRFNVDFWIDKRFTERFTARLGVIAFTQNDVGDSDRDFERDYIRGTLRLRYRFARRWSIYGAYIYTFNDQQESLSVDRTVRNNFVSAGIAFDSEGWRW